MKIADHIKDNISYREWLRKKYDETGDKAWKEIGDALREKIVDDLGLQHRLFPSKKKCIAIEMDNCYECQMWEAQIYYEGITEGGRYFCHLHKEKIGRLTDKVQSKMKNGFPEFCKEVL